MRINPLAVFVFLCGVMTLGIAGYAWRQRATPGARAFVLFMAAMAVYVFGYSFELASLSLAGMVLWSKVEYVGILTYAPLYLIFVFEYVGRGRWLTPARRGLLFAIPAVLLALKFGDDTWHLLYRTAQVDASGLIPLLSFTRGPAYYVSVAYNLVVVTLGLWLLWQKRRHGSALYLSQTNLMLAAALCLYLTYLFYLSGLEPPPGLRELDLNPFVFTLWGAAIGWSMFRHRLFDLAPIAREALIEILSDGVVVLDAQQRVVDANPAALRIGGWSRPPLGQPAEQAFRDWGWAPHPDPDGQATATEIRRGPDGQTVVYEVGQTPLNDRRGVAVGSLVLLHDVTRRIRAEERLREISLVDELTGLHNRRGFNMLSAQLAEMADRMNLAVALIYADLDEMKRINDTLGHAAGDQALITTARILKSTFRAADIVARIGGDEFVVLALETTDQTAAVLLDRLQTQLRASPAQPLSISFGMARLGPGTPRTIEALLAEADRRMYAQKAEHQRG